LNKAEMLVWDQWGIMNDPDPLDPRHLEMLDRLARTSSDPDCSATELLAWAQRDALRLPTSIVSYSLASSSPIEVDVGRIVESMGRTNTS
jgi:hypothetical protein